MIPVTGRIVRNATVRELEDGKKVVHFTVAHNHHYSTKKDGKREMKTITNYYNCSYWRSTTVAQYLTKGTTVFIGGFIHATGYQKGDEILGQLNFHVEDLELFSGGERPATTTNSEPVTAEAETGDDLPF